MNSTAGELLDLLQYCDPDKHASLIFWFLELSAENEKGGGRGEYFLAKRSSRRQPCPKRFSHPAGRLN